MGQTAEVVGFLAREHGCIGIFDTFADEFVAVVWPPGWRAYASEHGAIRVTDTNGRAVATTNSGLGVRGPVLNGGAVASDCGGGSDTAIAIRSEFDIFAVAEPR